MQKAKTKANFGLIEAPQLYNSANALWDQRVLPEAEELYNSARSIPRFKGSDKSDDFQQIAGVEAAEWSRLEQLDRPVY